MECAEGVDSDVVLGVAEGLHILHPAHSGSREEGRGVSTLEKMSTSDMECAEGVDSDVVL